MLRILYSARVMSNKLATAAWKGPDGRWAMGNGRSHVCASVEENPAPWFQHGRVLDQQPQNTKLSTAPLLQISRQDKLSVKVDADRPRGCMMMAKLD